MTARHMLILLRALRPQSMTPAQYYDPLRRQKRREQLGPDKWGWPERIVVGLIAAVLLAGACSAAEWIAQEPRKEVR